MLLTITLILISLVIINLLLLKFSCNKTDKTKKADKKPIILRPGISLSSSTQVLAPTGS
ncbi:hypothetical protein SAMN05216261_0835 [Algibacter luteus]|uniref:Uncharacterized protein n=1 Tax=Algibacter luteus TaxID=1178825 RepID=A0A1M6BPN9_9FLAO|nr:hypothetical protein SAMN05216261_0835 [Algibacter luteus]